MRLIYIKVYLLTEYDTDTKIVSSWFLELGRNYGYELAVEYIANYHKEFLSANFERFLEAFVSN